MSRRVASLAPGLASGLLLVALLPISGAAAVQSWAVEVGSSGTVLADGAGLSIPVTITCPTGYAQRKFLNVQVYDDKNTSVGFHYSFDFPCDGTPHTSNVVMDSGSRVRPGTVFTKARLDFCEDGACDRFVSDLKEVRLATGSVDLDSTSTLAISPTGTVLGKGVTMTLENPSTVIYMGQVSVPVTVTCSPGLHPEGSATVSLYQRHGSDTTPGYGRSDHEPVCDGTPQTFDLLVDAWYSRFRQGAALAIASVLLCPDGQSVSPGGSGPGCRRISEAAEITLVR